MIRIDRLGEITPVVVSSDTSVVRLVNGKIQAVGTGTAQITAYAYPYDASTSIKVSVKNKLPKKIIIKGKKKVKVGKMIHLKAELINLDGKVRWSVNKKKLATINKKTGKLTGLKPGVVKVTARVGKTKKTVKIKIIK